MIVLCALGVGATQAAEVSEVPSSSIAAAVAARAASPQWADEADPASGSVARTARLGATRPKVDDFGLLFREDFQGYDAPGAPYPIPDAPVILYDLDGRTPHAEVNYVAAAWIIREDFKFDAMNRAAFSTSRYAPAGAADDWMVLPAVTVSTNTRLKWRAVAYDADKRDGYQVLVSPTGSANTAAFTQTAFTTAAENATWTERSLSLAAYAGQTIRVAFRNNSNDQSLLLLDDIVIENRHLHDAEVLDYLDPPIYTQVPAFLEYDAPFSLQAYNNGWEPVTNLIVTAEAQIDGVAVDSQVAAHPTLASGETYAVGLTLPVVAEGRYDIVASVSISEADGRPVNDSVRFEGLIEGTADTLARDDGNVVRTLGIGDGTGGELGQDFEIDGPAELVGARFALLIQDSDNDGVLDYPGRTLRVHLRGWDIGAGQPGIVRATAEVTVPATAVDGELVELYAQFPIGTPMPAPRFVLTVEEPVGAPMLTLAQTSWRYAPGSTWAIWPTSGGWQDPASFNTDFARALQLRAVLRQARPIASDDVFSVAAGQTLSAVVSGNDRVSPRGTTSWTMVTPPLHGSADLGPGGELTYIPAAGFVGVDTFTYKACDTFGECMGATVTINVLGVGVVFANGFESP